MHTSIDLSLSAFEGFFFFFFFNWKKVDERFYKKGWVMGEKNPGSWKVIE